METQFGAGLGPRSEAHGRSARTKRGRDKKPKSGSPLKKVIAAVLVLLLAVGGYVGYLVWETYYAIRTVGVDREVPPGESVKDKPKAFLLLGVDSRAKTGTLNTDVIMVAALNPATKSATVVSVPRDSLIQLDGYKQQKANQFYAGFLRSVKKDGLSGEQAELAAKEELRKMFGKMFGIPIDYAATINFKGFIDVVDALGGVTVDVDMDMRYVDRADGTNINLSKGVQKLNGQQALDFIRYRKSNDGKNMSDDFSRNKRQGEVLAAIADKLKSFGGAAKLGSVISAVGDNMKTDMPSSEITQLFTTYFGIDKDNIEYIPLQGDWRSPYVYLNTARLEEARAALSARMAE